MARGYDHGYKDYFSELKDLGFGRHGTANPEKSGYKLYGKDDDNKVVAEKNSNGFNVTIDVDGVKRNFNTNTVEEALQRTISEIREIK